MLESTHSQEAEMMVLGCMLTSNSDLEFSLGCLDDEAFYFYEHKLIFQAMKEVFIKNQYLDTYLLRRELTQPHKTQTLENPDNYITKLIHFVGTSAYCESYVDDLLELRSKRDLLTTARNITDAIYKKATSSQIILQAHSQLECIEKSRRLDDKFQIKNLAELGWDCFDTEPPPKNMLFEYRDSNGRAQGLIPKGIASMLVGQGGVGKTHFLTQAAISIATQTPFLDIFLPTEQTQGNVFLGLAENDPEDIQRLLFKSTRRLFQSRPDNDDIKRNLKYRLYPFSFLGQNCQFTNKNTPTAYFYDLKRHLITAAPKHGWSIIILDPIARFLGAEAEVDNASATRFIALIEELTQDIPGNPTILFSHHMNKAAAFGTDDKQQAARGSSALTDGVRMQINLRKPIKGSDSQTKKVDHKDIVMSMTKSNFTPILDDIHLQKQWDGYLCPLKTQSSYK